MFGRTIPLLHYMFLAKNKDLGCQRILGRIFHSHQQLAHHTYPIPREDHIRRESRKAFADGVEDPVIEIQLLLGGEKTVNKALWQHLKLLACATSHQTTHNMCQNILSELISPQRSIDTRRSACWRCGEPGHRVSPPTPMERKQERTICARRVMKGLKERHADHQESMNGNQVTT